jgi:hypothetical protein
MLSDNTMLFHTRPLTFVFLVRKSIYKVSDPQGEAKYDPSGTIYTTFLEDDTSQTSMLSAIQFQVIFQACSFTR